MLDVYVNVKDYGEVPERTWTIAQIADEFGVTHRTVRYYEQQGLISPERRGTLRIYHPRDRVRLALVLRGKRIGFDLDKIRTIVNMYDDMPGEAGQLRYLLEQVEIRRHELNARKADIDATLAELEELERRCRDDLHELEPAASPSSSGGAARLPDGRPTAAHHHDTAPVRQT